MRYGVSGATFPFFTGVNTPQVMLSHLAVPCASSRCAFATSQ